MSFSVLLSKAQMRQIADRYAELAAFQSSLYDFPTQKVSDRKIAPYFPNEYLYEISLETGHLTKTSIKIGADEPINTSTRLTK